MKTNKGNTMIDLNTSQKEQVSVLYKHYKTDTVTRAEINSLVSKNKLKNPSWLINHEGFFNLFFDTRELISALVTVSVL